MYLQASQSARMSGANQSLRENERWHTACLRILEMPPIEQAEQAAEQIPRCDWVYEACRVVAVTQVIFMRLGIPLFSSRLPNQYSSTTLKVLLERSNVASCWEGMTGVLLWITLVGAAVTASSHEKRWMRAIAVRCTVLLAFDHRFALLNTLHNLLRIMEYVQSERIYKMRDVTTKLLRGVEETLREPASTFESISDVFCSGKQNWGVQGIKLFLQWELDAFYEQGLDGCLDLEHVLSLSGTAERAYAATCAVYAKRLWPRTAMETFGLLKAIAKQKAKARPCSDTTLNQTIYLGAEWLGQQVTRPSPKSSGEEISLLGPRDICIAITQQLAWLSAICRLAEPSKLTCSRVSVWKDRNGSIQLELLDLEPICSKEKLCWWPLFFGSVVAEGFPIPDRGTELGVETSFEIMATLGRIRYPMEYLDGVVLKGRHTILVPTGKTANGIQWHFIEEASQRTKRIPMSIIREHCATTLENLGLSELMKERAFIGYCENVCSPRNRAFRRREHSNVNCICRPDKRANWERGYG